MNGLINGIIDGRKNGIIDTLGSLLNQWQDYPAPVGYDWTLPFTVQKKGNTFQLKEDFNLQAHANITVAKTYYVDKATGSDANTGADWEHALLKLKTALEKPDVDRIIFRGYYYRNEVLVWPSRSVEIIGESKETAHLTGDVGNQVGTFTKTNNYYSATIGEYVGNAHDKSHISTNGRFTDLKVVASIAAVDAEAGTFFTDWANTRVYVRTFDDRAPDSNLILATTAIYATKDNLKFYFKNCTLGTVMFRNSTAAGGLKCYFENVAMNRVNLNGVDECILKDIYFNVSTWLIEQINTDWRNGIITKHCEINCDCADSRGASDIQNTTIHNSSRVFRLNSSYKNASGQNIGDTGASSQSWNLGLTLDTTLVGTGFYHGGKAWLDTVTIKGSANYDIMNLVGATTYVRNCSLEKGVNNILGTIENY